MPERLDSKVALITGTGGGQGRAAALAFTAAGAKVVGADLDATENDRTLELVHAAGGTMAAMGAPLRLHALMRLIRRSSHARQDAAWRSSWA